MRKAYFGIGARDMTGIVLAGGQSSRMGSSKALLSLEGKPVIQWVIDALSAVCQEVIIAANDKETYRSFGCRVVEDLFPGGGPLAGIHAGLSTSASRYNFFAACDMPLLQREIVRYMFSQAEGHDAVIPVSGPHVEPLHAIYSKSCLTAVEELLTAKRKKVTAFLPQVKVNYLQEEVLNRHGRAFYSFFNINTPQDWLTARRYLRDLEA